MCSPKLHVHFDAKIVPLRCREFITPVIPTLTWIDCQ